MIRFLVIIFCILTSLRAHAQSASYFAIFGGNQFSLIQANSSIDSTKIKLVSESQKSYGFDFQFGNIWHPWFLRAEILNFNYKDGPTVSPESFKNFKGTQGDYDFGRLYPVFIKSHVFLRYSLSYKEVLYAKPPTTTFELKKSGLPGIDLHFDFPIIRYRAKFSSPLQAKSGIFASLGGAYRMPLGSSDLKSVFSYDLQLILRKSLGSSLEFDFLTSYGIEHSQTDFYDQQRQDLKFFFTLRYIPQPKESDFFPPPPP